MKSSQLCKDLGQECSGQMEQHVQRPRGEKELTSVRSRKQAKVRLTWGPEPDCEWPCRL